MKKYIVQFRFDGIFDNYIGDYILAENPEEALELAKEWFTENDGELEEIEIFRVIDYVSRETLLTE